jgi:hypothetical protein
MLDNAMLRDINSKNVDACWIAESGGAFNGDQQVSPRRAYGALRPLSSIRRIDCRAADECLNQTLFGALSNARQTLEEWREDYNWAQTPFRIGQPDADGILEVKADGQNSHLRSEI